MAPFKTIRLQSIFTPLLIIFVLAGVGLFVAAILTTDGATTIAITPKLVPVHADITVNLATAGPTSDEAPLAATVTSEKLSETVSATPAATGALVDAHAHGTMTVINNSPKAQTLAAQTRFRSDSGIIVRSANRLDIPAGKSVTVSVTADPIGTSGNVAAGRWVIVALWPGLQDKIYGQTSDALAGGQTRQGATLDATALQTASATAADKIKARFGASAVGTLRDLEPDSVTTNPSSTVASDTYQVTVAMTGRTITYDPSALDTILRRELGKLLTTGQALLTVESPTITVVGTTSLSFQISARGQAAIGADDPLLQAGQYLGQRKADVVTTLLASGKVQAAAITIVPQWQQTLPNRADRINIVLNPALP